MNQNAYTYNGDPRNSGSNQNQQQLGLSFHPSSYQTSTYTTSSTVPFHSSSSAAFIPNNQNNQRRMGTVVTGEEKNLVTMLDAYFVENVGPSTSSTWNNQQSVQGVQVPQLQQSMSTYSALNGELKNEHKIQPGFQSVSALKISNSPDKGEKDRQKKARQAEAARMRYHRLTPEEKRELNLKRTLAQKRKRQREKELEELESILRETNDIQEDPDITEQLREKRMRAKWAEAARTRYARMTPEERRAHNNRRRLRQMQNALAAIKSAGLSTGDPIKDEEAVRAHIKSQNSKKAEAARDRYHRMSDEEKRCYNQRRTEAFRRRRMEEEMLLAMPIGRINGEALDRAQQIVVRNAKRAEAARLRYQRMTPDQRKMYNQKRYTPKRRRADSADGSLDMMDMTAMPKKDELDALTSLERDVMKRTQQANAILRTRGQDVDFTMVDEKGIPQIPGQQNNQTYLVQQTSNGQQHIGQPVQIQLGGHQQVHSVHQIPVTNQIQINQQHIPSQIYTTGGMMLSSQPQQQQQQQVVQNGQSQSQILNPYGQRA